MKGACQLREQRGSRFERGAGDMENAMLEFGHQVDHLAAIGSEDISMFSGNPCDQTFQAQARVSPSWFMVSCRYSGAL